MAELGDRVINLDWTILDHYLLDPGMAEIFAECSLSIGELEQV